MGEFGGDYDREIVPVAINEKLDSVFRAWEHIKSEIKFLENDNGLVKNARYHEELADLHKIYVDIFKVNCVQERSRERIMDTLTDIFDLLVEEREETIKSDCEVPHEEPVSAKVLTELNRLQAQVTEIIIDYNRIMDKYRDEVMKLESYKKEADL
jgi:hypothetical protein